MKQIRGLNIRTCLACFLLLVCATNPNANSQTPEPAANLHEAIEAGDTAAVKKLLDNGANPDTKDDRGRTPLVVAAMYSRVDIIKLLFEHKANVNLKDRKGQSPLYNASFTNNKEIIRLLVSAGADVNATDDSGWTPLMAAASYNKLASVEALLSTKLADLNKKSGRGRTALILAAMQKPDSDNFSIIKALLDAGADYNPFEDRDKNAMMYAAEKGNEAAIRLLVAKGANINGRNSLGRTPLMYAVASVSSVFNRVVENMIEMHAEVNARDSDGDTPLLTAARFGRVVTAEVLLSMGADLNARDKSGDNALTAAAGSKWRGEEGEGFFTRAFPTFAAMNAADMLSFLLALGIDVNSVNNAGETALMLASSREDDSGIALVRVLLEKGASPLLRDKAGKTARSRAEESNNEEVATVLTITEKTQRKTPTQQRAAQVKEPPESLWAELAVVVLENGHASIGWAHTNRIRDKMVREFVIDLTGAGFGQDESSHDPRKFWESLDAGRKEQLGRKHSALFAFFEDARASDAAAQFLAPQLSSMLSSLKNPTKEDEREIADMLEELDYELEKRAPLLFRWLRNTGIGMDADTVSRLLGDYLKGPTIRSLREMIETGAITRALSFVEHARAAPFLLLQQKRPVLAQGRPERLRQQLVRLNLEILRKQQEFIRLASDFKASGGSLRDVFPTEDEGLPPWDEKSKSRKKEAAANEGAQQLRAAHDRVQNLYVQRMALIAEMVDKWADEPVAIDTPQAAKLMPAGTLSVVFAYEAGALSTYASKSDKIHVFLLHGGARRGGEDGLNLTPPILTRTLELSPDEVSREITAFRAAVTHANTSADDIAQKGRKLFAELFPGEIGNAIRGARRLIISPDGPLWDMPFAALITNVSGRPNYLGIEKPISYTASFTQLAYFKKLPARSSKGHRPFALVLGDPDFNRATPNSDTSLLDRSFLDPLPASRAEAECISKLYGATVPSGALPSAGGVLLLKDQATESSVRRWAARADVIHLATHGFIDSGRQLTMNSAVWLTPPASGNASNDFSDDGALQANEVFNQLSLTADIVVISACEMGRGQDLKGSGVGDMIWALHAAGARSVVASQWEVADESTSVLMSAFHELICKGTDKDEALMKAMQRLYGMANTAHPYFWAPFVLSGDTKNKLTHGSGKCTCNSTR